MGDRANIDRKPPQVTGSERDTVLLLLRYQRESFVRKVEDVDDVTAARPLVGSGTSLLWLTRHLARAEELWFLHRFAGNPLPDEPARPRDTMAAAIADYRAGWARVDAVVGATPDLETRCRADGYEVDLRWVLMHLLEETARHAGHADILRELIDGRTGR